MVAKITMNIYRVQIYYIKRVISKFTKTKAEHKIKRKKKNKDNK